MSWRLPNTSGKMRRTVPYLICFCELCAGAKSAATAAFDNLPAPPSEVRIQLKTSAAGNDWKRVLDTAEKAMSTPCGRGWLDLQRYVVRALDELGYKEAAKGLRVELKAFLAEFPQLASAMLSDDTGTANPETLAWLKKETMIA